MDLLNEYNDDDIKQMIHLFETHKKLKEYRKNYYRNKYNNDDLYKNRKKLSNQKYMRKQLLNK
tara:strand:+ start:7896 stop:8084 length:189 start_codon:yes stop_codon:yes gene_type:complete